MNTRRQKSSAPTVASTPVGPTDAARRQPRPVRSHIDGFWAVSETLSDREFDLYKLPAAEWQAMSPRQRDALIRTQNQRAQRDDSLGEAYVSAPLERAVERARTLYVGMTPEQRRH